MTAVLHDNHENCEGEIQDNLLDGTRDGGVGQLSPLQHVSASVEGLGDELHGHAVDEWDNSLGHWLNRNL